MTIHIEEIFISSEGTLEINDSNQTKMMMLEEYNSVSQNAKNLSSNILKKINNSPIEDNSFGNHTQSYTD